MFYGVVLLDIQRNLNILEIVAIWEWRDLEDI